MQEIKKIADIDKILRHCAAGNYIFRGTTEVYSNEIDGINSSLYRWAKTYNVLFNENFSILDMEKEIVEKAKRCFPPDTSNIEILTDLRHYGGNVTLIDFSRNLYVALFFACNGKFEDDGELMTLEADKFKRIERVDYNEREAQTGVIYPANTQVSQRRTIAQSSIFVIDPNGYIDNNKYKTFKIKKEVKKIIIDYLRKFHNIDAHAIYNDLIGFITNEENYTSSEVEFFMGVGKQKEQKHKEAIEHYNKVIEINPQYAETYYNRGVAKSVLGKHEEAIEDYSEAIEINPQFAEAYYNRGAAKSALGQKQEAIEDYSKAIEIDPQHAQAYNNRGNAKSALGENQEAIEDYSKAIEINPQHTGAYTNRGNAKSALGRNQEAIEDYSKAIEINPEFAGAYYNRGTEKSALGQTQEAIEDHKKAIDLDPKLANKK